MSAEGLFPQDKKNQALVADKALKYYTATHFQLMWWRFRKHRLALLGSVLLGLYFLVALLAEFWAPLSPFTRNTRYILGPPQILHFIDAEGNFHWRPFVYGVETHRHPETLRMVFEVDTSVQYPLRFFIRGEEYKLCGVIPWDIHLYGIKNEVNQTTSGFVHFLGTDDLGRDVMSRVLYATRTSLSVGVIGVCISFVLGLLIGGVSGYFGRGIDYLIQRMIEFIRSIPTLPLWMAIAAAMPKEWSPLQIYLAITILLCPDNEVIKRRRIRFGECIVAFPPVSNIGREDTITVGAIHSNSITVIINNPHHSIRNRQIIHSSHDKNLQRGSQRDAQRVRFGVREINVCR